MTTDAHSHEVRPVAPAPDPMLWFVRGGIGLLFILALLNGAFLFFVPAQAKAHYAWAIMPPVSAAFIGAGYVAGALPTGLGVFLVRRWRSIRGVVPGFCVLGVALFVATLLHTDKFRWDYAPTWGWTAIYAVIPPLAIYFWVCQGRIAGDEGPAERDSRLGSLPAASLAVGLMLLAAGVALYIAPAGLLEDWPWPLTPLLARVFGGWYFLAAVILLFLGSSVSRPHEVVIPYATVACWSLLLLLLPLLYPDTVETGAPLFVPFLALHALTLTLCVVISARGVVLMRRDGEHL